MEAILFCSSPCPDLVLFFSCSSQYHIVEISDTRLGRLDLDLAYKVVKIMDGWNS